DRMGTCPWTSAATSTGTTSTGSSIRRPRGSFPQIPCGPEKGLVFGRPAKDELGLSRSPRGLSSGDRAEFLSESVEDLCGSDDFRKRNALVRDMDAFRLTGSEDDRPGIVRGVIRHLGPVGDADDLRPREISQQSDVVRGRGHRGRRDLVEQPKIDGLPRRRGGFPEEGLDVVLRRAGRMTAIEIRDAQVGDQIRFRPALNSSQADRNILERVLRTAIRFQLGQEPHHTIDCVVPEMRQAPMGTPPGDRRAVPEDSYLARDDPEPRPLDAVTAFKSRWTVGRRPKSSIAPVAALRMFPMSDSGVEGIPTNSVRWDRTYSMRFMRPSGRARCGRWRWRAPCAGRGGRGR